jgi:hypothetical protein
VASADHPSTNGAPAAEREDGSRLPVLAEAAEPELVEVEARPIDRPTPAALPGAAVAAAGGFLAGFATLVLARVLRRRGRRGAVVRPRGRRRAIDREVAASRSFLVDVHMLRR